MARTTEAAVKELIDWNPEIPVQPHIDTANDVVTNICGAAGYSTVTLELVERWLAAHYYSSVDPQYQAEKTLQAGVTYSGKTGMYLENSRYGQQAMSIEYKGLLSAWNDAMKNGGPVTVGAQWLGTCDPYAVGRNLNESDGYSE